jgi:hypothetical protein
MPLNLSLVLDRSGSMQGKKIEALRAATQELLDLLQPQDTLSVILFNHRTRTLVAAQHVTPERKAAIQADIRRVDADGGTNMAPAMEAGLIELRKYMQPGPGAGGQVNRLVLLTDGLTEREKRCLRQADEAAGDRGREEPGQPDDHLDGDEVGHRREGSAQGQAGEDDVAVLGPAGDDAVVAQAAAEVHGVRPAVRRHLGDQGALRGGQAEVAAALGEDGALGGPADHAHDERSGALTADPERVGVVGPGGRRGLVVLVLVSTHGRGAARERRIQLRVDLADELVPQRGGGHHADEHEDDGQRDEEGPQQARPQRQALRAPRPHGSSGRQLDAGLIMYPAPRSVWIIGSRPRSILRRR